MTFFCHLSPSSPPPLPFSSSQRCGGLALEKYTCEDFYSGLGGLGELGGTHSASVSFSSALKWTWLCSTLSSTWQIPIKRILLSFPEGCQSGLFSILCRCDLQNIHTNSHTHKLTHHKHTTSLHAFCSASGRLPLDAVPTFHAIRLRAPTSLGSSRELNCQPSNYCSSRANCCVPRPLHSLTNTRRQTHTHLIASPPNCLDLTGMTHLNA